MTGSTGDVTSMQYPAFRQENLNMPDFVRLFMRWNGRGSFSSSITSQSKHITNINFWPGSDNAAVIEGIKEMSIVMQILWL